MSPSPLPSSGIAPSTRAITPPSAKVTFPELITTASTLPFSFVNSITPPLKSVKRETCSGRIPNSPSSPGKRTS